MHVEGISLRLPNLCRVLCNILCSEIVIGFNFISSVASMVAILRKQVDLQFEKHHI